LLFTTLWCIFNKWSKPSKSSYRNPNLGLATKARVCKVVGQEGSPRVASHAPESHISCSQEWKRMREWTFTLPSELSFWELKSQWTPKFSEGNFRGHNPLDWRVIYIIGKLLKLRCLKWACMTHLDI
jgi:hypothetical protein